MNIDRKDNLFLTTETIADHLVLAWNFCATLRRLQHVSKQCPDIIDANRHFVSTIVYSMWDSLFIKLWHCTDTKRQAIGFPKLFKQLRAYLPEGHDLKRQVDDHEKLISTMEPQKKITNWRHQMISHFTALDVFDAFYKANVCSLDEIEGLISKYKEILHVYSLSLLSHGFAIEDLGRLAYDGVDRIIKGMIKEAEQGGTANRP